MYYKSSTGEVRDFNFAPSPASDWTRLTKTAGKKARAEYCAAELRKILKPGDGVYTILRHVSKSGMMRHLSVCVIDQCAPRDITYLVADACGYSVTDRNYIKVHGCGMDVGFETVYNLSHALFRGNFICTGEGCRSNDHSNGDRDYSPHKHSDAGYALSQAWL